MRRLAAVVAALAMVSSAACADTFTNTKTGETVEGKLLGTAKRDGKQFLLAKVSGTVRQFPADIWKVKRQPSDVPAPAKPSSVTPEPAPEEEPTEGKICFVQVVVAAEVFHNNLPLHVPAFPALPTNSPTAV